MTLHVLHEPGYLMLVKTNLFFLRKNRSEQCVLETFRKKKYIYIYINWHALKKSEDIRVTYFQ